MNIYYFERHSVLPNENMKQIFFTKNIEKKHFAQNFSSTSLTW